MSEVERAAVQDSGAGDLTLEELNNQLPAEILPDADFLSNEQLATLVTVIRRPPELLLQDTPLNQNGEINATIAAQLEPLDGLTTTDLAYAIAELLVRREPELRDLASPDSEELLTSLGDLARMYQHLLLLQTGYGGR